MTDPRILNKAISDGQSAMYARQLEETIRTVKSELAVARQGLADVARVLCPDQVDILTGKHPGSSAATLPLEELINTMKGTAQTYRLIAANSTKSPGSKEDKLLARVAELESLLRAEKRRADLFERAKANTEQTLEAERSRAAKAARGRGQQGGGDRYAENAPSSSSATEPLVKERPAPRPAHSDTQVANTLKEWEEWEVEFEAEELPQRRDEIKKIVIFVGSTGKTTTPEIVDSTGLKNERVGKMAKHAIEMHSLFIDQDSPLREPEGGRPKNSYNLSPKGEWYYRKLTGQPPEVSLEEALMKSGKTGKHAGLIKKVGARFDALGWKVDYDPERIYFDDRTYSEPDLIIQKDNQTINIEVETGEHTQTESADDWAKKFTHAHQATKGVLCFVTASRSQLTTLLGKVNFWLSQSRMYPVYIYATTLEHLNQVQENETPWLKEEQKTA